MHSYIPEGREGGREEGERRREEGREGRREGGWSILLGLA